MNLPYLLALQLYVRRMDRWQRIALVFCTVAALLQWCVAPQLEQHIHTMQMQLDEKVSPQSSSPQHSLDSERLTAFRERLADNAERSALLKIVFAEAAKAGIPLPQGDYALSADEEGHYAKLQISLPISGSYAQIRGYARTLLDALPAVALDEISFRRDSIKSPQIEAHLKLTLYLKAVAEP